MKRKNRDGSGGTMHFPDTTANHCGGGGSRFSVPTPTSCPTLELGRSTSGTEVHHPTRTQGGREE
ncbi:hypothetical protein TIFTF001_024700 [Ficus carica]|uniref:Uncharacterized protein n=1 Tax=Ficus carica TaxID=3494 RepID=A0AA88AW23_FICCA|nr:hypothetical protein TIFTF001_024700 [Ficus carica]